MPLLYTSQNPHPKYPNYLPTSTCTTPYLNFRYTNSPRAPRSY